MMFFDEEKKVMVLVIGKNRVYQNGDLFIVEKYEHSAKNKDYYCFYNSYESIKKAIQVAKNLKV
jgi:hypothetical protein